jgi:general stress protein 26
METPWFWGFQISFVRIGHSINRALHQPGSKIRYYSKKSEKYQHIKKNQKTLLFIVNNCKKYHISQYIRATIITGQICIDLI